MGGGGGVPPLTMGARLTLWASDDESGGWGRLPPARVPGSDCPVGLPYGLQLRGKALPFHRFSPLSASAGLQCGSRCK